MLLVASPRKLRIIRLVSLALLSGAMAACGFDTGGGTTNCLISMGNDSGTGSALDSAHDAAQSFVVGTTQTVQNITLRLKVISTDNVTRPNGNITVYIYSDAATTNPIHPTTPSASNLGGINEYKAISASDTSVFPLLNQAYNITFTLPTALSLSPGAYWVYVKSGVVPNANLKVVWEQSVGDAYSQGFPWYQGTLPAGFDFMTNVNCGS